MLFYLHTHRDFFEYSPGVLHLLTGSNAYSTILSTIETVSQGSKVICGKFLGINSENKKVFIQSKLFPSTVSEISYDAVIMATGSPYTFPIKTSESVTRMNDRITDIKEYVSQLQQMKNIIVLGGGLVGVELAAELVTRVPGLQVSRDVFLLPPV